MGVWWMSDAERFAEFRRTTENSSFEAGVGLPGRVLASGKPEWFEDAGAIAIPRAEAARNAGLKAAFAFPLSIGAEVAGVMEFFSFEVLKPDKRLLEIVALVGHQLGAVIARLRYVTALRESEHRTRLILDMAQSAYIEIGADGCVLDWNPEAERTFGWSRDDTLGKRLSELIIPMEYRAAHEAGMQRFLRTGEGAVLGRRFEITGLRKDGNTIPIELTITAIPIGQTHVFSAFLHDISERKLAERELHERDEQLRHAVKHEALGRLAGGVAHDFNNLLTSIKGHAHLAVESAHGQEELQEYLREIDRAADRAATLTSQLLAFGRKQLVRPQAIDLNTIVHNIEKLLARLLPETIPLSVELADGVAAVFADRGQLEQIIVNLVVNARDAIESGGEVRIQTANVELGEEASTRFPYVVPGEYVMLSVSDNGAGIPPEILPHIFEPFFTTKPVGRGTGLGLSTVFGIVKQNSGYLWADSELGAGSTFRVYLPRTGMAPTVEITAPAPEVHAVMTGTVVLVEDEESVRTLVAKVVRGMGLTVLVAESPGEAILLTRRHRSEVDLLLTDVVMPDMTGLEMVRQLEQEGLRAAVLYMSGYAKDAVLEPHALERGHQFIEKPFSPLQLREAVTKALADRSRTPVPG